MASELYPYPAELDSDDEGSIEYDWENDSQIDDDGLSFDMDRLQIRGGSAVPGTPLSGTPPPRATRPPNNTTAHLCAPPKPLCVACKARSVYKNYVTCSLACIEKLCKDGPVDTTMCTYCHRRTKITGKDQCGETCAENAKIACLLCKVRPRNRRYHLCGKTCKSIATKSTPLILEIPKGHMTYDMVETKFKKGWSAPATRGPQPTISKIYKIIENDEFLRPYELYRQRVGPKESYSCGLCNILKTSFNVDVAKGNGAFGKAIYTSTASNKAFSFCGAAGAMLLTKVVLGKVKQVNGWNEVMSCPPGFDSVVFDRKFGTHNLNETIVYSNDAIRPVFLIIFQ
ncbi:hypothetical protein EST38_g13098 [Candolleomyces aberdarensis]|uniref:PARP catalytic domain-containing protein n=1 Tax=Candolleomyces aberdarensis TaxID=2316362 RepID=A0A4Q2D0T0_9AGAR|nr:hypothetical protein EST38_g13098 [Candolleomyces aberdarensis]